MFDNFVLKLISVVAVVILLWCDSQEPAVTVKLAVSVIRCMRQSWQVTTTTTTTTCTSLRWNSKYLTADGRMRGGCCLHLLVTINCQIKEIMVLITVFCVHLFGKVLIKIFRRVLGGNSQNILCKFVRFFVTLGLKILRL